MEKVVDRNEEVNLSNVYIGIVTDNVTIEGYTLGIGISSFGILEKQDFEIGEVGASNSYTVYKDLGQERYSYVDQQGAVFIPKGKEKFPASNHLRTVNEMKSIRDILSAVIERCGGLVDEDPSIAGAIASYQTIIDQIDGALRIGVKPIVHAGQVLDQFDRWVNLYMVAYGNPLERDRDDIDEVIEDDERDLDEDDLEEETELEDEDISYEGSNVIDMSSRFHK